ncbi:uncharacterized protein LOC134832037 [Culicoides brevitarsis]|uniref:uncharacterized protein LOC134832037 n=1 Tax=Culicoides brevitarsis TaxID=469753 RepID=UPI00307BBDD4
MAFKFVLLVALAYCASAAHIHPNAMMASQHRSDTRIDNQSQSAEQLQRQDEYLRNIDHSSDSIQNDYYQQHSNRLRDNEYRRVNYYYAGNQQDRNQYQNHESDQFAQHQSPDAMHAIRHYQRQMYEPLMIASATNSYPMFRSYQQHHMGPYNSRVTFNSPLVSYRY